ncbi:hypothetical protein FDP41_012949 [Naegleria fowleri]|uniref:Ribosomal eL28/Mak16 domain-containing protein n=1 Tax=Naegleria fowleri TaxID=5763 RepID=A0A6A5C1Y7_NAEFO|nr:uncharacterized protein FDP41_013337 [Naegleria fowleri]XP_044565874.1 uncharacterized protein FDP41_012949 [Naegleria fowleri]KAF0980554.1 hypothetical protein FDP41_013337 [Naegleria fowleri]KAF0981161.1 hypothetical protein FDP41_012949 [Naegleria fowleri]CAG4717146.1 unnamed protein product [Naegleria fowleri]
MSLIWEITKNNSSLLKRTRLYGGASFHTSPTNPLNINSEKYTKTNNVSVDVTPKGDLLIKKSTHDASVRKPKEYVKKSKVANKQLSVTKAAKTIVETTEGEDFRGDLKTVLVARAAKLLRLKHKSKKTTKATQSK